MSHGPAERTHPRLRAWWTDNPADPDRMPVDDPDVQQLAAAISPASRPTDLGGVMSLNVRLDAAGSLYRQRATLCRRARRVHRGPDRQALLQAALSPAQCVAPGASGRAAGRIERDALSCIRCNERSMWVWSPR